MQGCCSQTAFLLPGVATAGASAVREAGMFHVNPYVAGAAANRKPVGLERGPAGGVSGSELSIASRTCR